MRKHLTYANIAATLALVIAVGGSSFAVAGKGGGKINGKKIKPGTISTKQLKAGAVTQEKVATGAIGTSQIADSAVTSTKLVPFRLVTAPGSGTADCANQRLISGGAESTGGPALVKSKPGVSPAWEAGSTGALNTLTTYAICMP